MVRKPRKIVPMNMQYPAEAVVVLPTRALHSRPRPPAEPQSSLRTDYPVRPDSCRPPPGNSMRCRCSLVADPEYISAAHGFGYIPAPQSSSCSSLSPFGLRDWILIPSPQLENCNRAEANASRPAKRPEQFGNTRLSERIFKLFWSLCWARRIRLR